MTKRVFAVTAVAAAALLASGPAFSQTKVTNQGVTPTEIVLGTHQDLSGPIKVWGVPVLNGMKLAVEEINAKGGILGRKVRLIAEDSAYDPKKAVLASQKMVEKDKVFAMIGPDRSWCVPTTISVGVTPWLVTFVWESAGPLASAAATATAAPAKTLFVMPFSSTAAPLWYRRVALARPCRLLAACR